MIGFDAERIDDLLPFDSTDAADTRELGRRVALLLPRPWVIALHGDMGAGKTQFVKGLADGLGLPGDDVTSPTFTIVHEYRRFERTLVHIDAYRISSPAELERLGLEDVLYSDRPCVVEWPERLGDLLPDDALHVALAHAGENRRRISLVNDGDTEDGNGMTGVDTR